MIISNIWAKGGGITDTNRAKKAAEWFYSTVFRDEAIRPRQPEPQERIPSPIRAARSLENGTPGYWQSRESIFVKQAKLLAGYEDDYVYDKPVLRYFPTYQSLTDPELRGYFSWRTKLRRGDIRKTSLSYAFLYIYELLNQIGVTDPMDGYRKLKDFQTAYGQIDSSIFPYLNRWLADYVIYYGLDAGLLANTPQVLFDRSITVLENIHAQDTDKVMYAVKQLSPKWLERSKFYAEFRADCDTVIVRVLRRMSEHYATRCKKTMVEQYFGTCSQFQVMLFDTAVFYDRQKRRICEYVVDEKCIYRCKNGFWTVQKHSCPPRPSAKLGDLIKTIDSVMRECYAYSRPIQRKLDTKWIIRIIQEETQGLLVEKKAAEDKKITIDYSRLEKIRHDAAATRDKLIVEEEAVEEEIPKAPPPPPPAPEGEASDTPLSRDEYRLLQSLLYGRDWGWVQSSGLMLSVLVDSINEKLFDAFADSVLILEDRPELIEDYIEDLKEMVHP
ncbi:MAG: TerB N-terminal domain-containing protein [Faecousia sp.]